MNRAGCGEEVKRLGGWLSCVKMCVKEGDVTCIMVYEMHGGFKDLNSGVLNDSGGDLVCIAVYRKCLEGHHEGSVA